MNTKQHKLKTFKKVIDSPRLVIQQDQFAENPRHNDNVCILLIKNSRGDKDKYYNDMLDETSQSVGCREDHMQLLIKAIEEHNNTKVLYSSYVKEYRHSGSHFSLGSHRGWDYSNNGFIFITEQNAKEFGVLPEQFDDIVSHELQELNCWLNGEVYEFYLYDDKGNQVDQCSDIYGLENIKAYLTEDWQQEDLTKYIKQ